MNIATCLFLIALLLFACFACVGFLASETNHKAQENRELGQEMNGLRLKLEAAQALVRRLEAENAELRARIQELELDLNNRPNATSLWGPLDSISDAQTQAILLLGALIGIPIGGVIVHQLWMRGCVPGCFDGRNKVLIPMSVEQRKAFIHWLRKQA
jgi:hypothetical protein